MPKVIIDTTNVPDSDFKAYDGPTPPPGQYRATLKKAWWTKSSNNKPMLKMIFELQTTHPEKKKFNGYPIWHNITNEQSTAWKMKELFVALATGSKSGIDFDEKGTVTRIGRAIPGKAEVLLIGKFDRYNGQDRLAIDRLAPLPGATSGDDEFEENFDDGEATSYEDSAAMAVAASTAASADSDISESEAGEEPAQGSSDDPPF
jgi:hypothetical protein